MNCAVTDRVALGSDPAGRLNSRAQLLHRFWQSASGYWRSGPRCAWPVTVSLIAVVFISLAITYAMNLWNRYFFDALEAKDAATALQQALLFPLLVAVYLALCVFGMWGRMTMQRTWRAWLNEHILQRWLTRSRFYQLELVGGNHKNPEHRINDDLRVATDMPVDFVTGFLTAVLSAVTFVGVLWVVGGSLPLRIGDNTITIPGFLVIAALVYSFLANGSMLAIARRFIPITESKNQAEAEYRYALTRVRENAESIALLNGEEAEHRRLRNTFGAVVARWRELMGQHMRAVIVSQGSAQLCGVVPVLLCTPRYLDGTMSLGQIMQVASAFTIVQGALSWFMDNYTRLADWTASARRVASLLLALDNLDDAERQPARKIKQVEAGQAALDLRGVAATLIDGKPILHNADVVICRGERVLVAGESGAGKSSLVRAVSGCWPWGAGEIRRAAGARVMVVPQRPYIPIGSLRAAAVYPADPNAIPRQQVDEVIAAVGLGHFRDRLDQAATWEQIMSEGEKQRIAIARLLLQRPEIVILDEATSALHVGGQAEIMDVLVRRLPGVTIVSVGHRPELEAFHQRKLIVGGASEGSTIVGDVPLHARPVRSIAGFSDRHRERQEAPPAAVAV